MKTLSIKVPEVLDRRLAELAERRGVTKSVLVREAMGEYVSRDRPAADRVPRGSFLALAEDLAGCIEGPEDLSSNKKHMDGYGQ